MNRERYNPRGCKDDTAYEAVNHTMQEAKTYMRNRFKRQEDAEEFVHAVKKMAEGYGFRLVDRIRFQDKETGWKYV